MENKILYQDSLIVIEEDSIILKNYYFPSMSSKNIFLKESRKLMFTNLRY